MHMSTTAPTAFFSRQKFSLLHYPELTAYWAVVPSSLNQESSFQQDNYSLGRAISRPKQGAAIYDIISKGSLTHRKLVVTHEDWGARGFDVPMMDVATRHTRVNVKTKKGCVNKPTPTVRHGSGSVRL